VAGANEIRNINYCRLIIVACRWGGEQITRVMISALENNGKLVIPDLSFQTRSEKRQQTAKDWTAATHLHFFYRN
jgi:hypothetical protein